MKKIEKKALYFELICLGMLYIFNIKLLRSANLGFKIIGTLEKITALISLENTLETA